jgi:hypothetical protein
MDLVMDDVTPELSKGRQRLESIVSRTEQQRNLLDFLLFISVTSARSSRGVNQVTILDWQFGWNRDTYIICHDVGVIIVHDTRHLLSYRQS